jgi:predicted  nucleic acid-binding Zn-ribbon protein
MDEEVQTVVTQDDLAGLKNQFHNDIEGLQEQIRVLQARAAALEGQLARIEPMVEARSSKTEKLVMELQIDMRRLTKTLEKRDEVEGDKLVRIESMLKTLLDRSA